MQENLVIVESPAKAKTIEKFLGKDYVVKSSFGHIRDLSKKDLGINIGEDSNRRMQNAPHAACRECNGRLAKLRVELRQLHGGILQGAGRRLRRR